MNCTPTPYGITLRRAQNYQVFNKKFIYIFFLFFFFKTIYIFFLSPAYEVWTPLSRGYAKHLEGDRCLGVWLRITHFKLISHDFTIPRVITWAIRVLPLLLGCDCFRVFPQFDGYSRWFTSTKRPYIQPYHSMSDNSRFILAIPSLHTHR